MARLPVPLRVLLPLVLGTVAAGCVWNTSSPGVLLATDPPGARVLVDGEESGFATPAQIELDRSRPHRVAFVLEGYRTATRDLLPDTSWHVVPWSDGDLGLNVWRFPLFLTFRGLFFPFRFDDNVIPNRVYVPLEVATEG